jgi:4-hydroxy-tetrahydrodipicolinate synthase
MRRLMFDGADAALNARLQPLMGWLFAQPNPIGARCGVIRASLRLISPSSRARAH